MSIAATVGLPIVTATPACIHDGFVALERLKGVDQMYLLYALKALEDELRGAGQTGSQSNINTEIVKQLTISLPPKMEQQRIAEALRDADYEMEALKRLAAKMEDIKQGIMQQLLTGRTRLPGFTGAWRLSSLRDDVTLISGQHVLAEDCNTRGAGVPYLTGPADFPAGRIRQTKFTEHPGSLCQAGDILVTVKGSGAGTLVEADAAYCISRQLMAIRPNTWSPRFLLYSLLHGASGITSAVTGLIPGLSRSDVLDQEVPVPPVREQRAIAAVLDDADSEIGALRGRVTKAKAIKQGMMQELLTGGTRLPLAEAVAA